MHNTVPSPPQQKVAVPAISGPQHCFYGLRAGQPCPHPQSYLNDLPSCVAVLGEVCLLPHLRHLHQLDLRTFLSGLPDKTTGFYFLVFFSHSVFDSIMDPDPVFQMNPDPDPGF
jgi:hypothetical protein